MIDLHLHLDGSLNPKNMLWMAEMSGVKLSFTEENELKKQMMVEPDCKNLGDYLEKFDLPLQVLQTKECLEYAVYELLKELQAQGLCYAEIRFTATTHSFALLSFYDTLSFSSGRPDPVLRSVILRTTG